MSKTEPTFLTMTVPVPVRLALALLVAVGIVLLSIAPGQARAGDSVFVWLVAVTPPPLQKLMHVAAYALFAFLCSWSFEWIAQRLVRSGLAVIIAVSLGAALEWYQTMVPGRFGNILDVGLNAIGAVLGALAAIALA